MKIGYARVSTREQSLSMQVDALKKAGCDQIHEEIASGAKTSRPVLEEIMRNLREGDTLIIWKLDRLGRNLAHLIHLTTQLIEKKVGLISLIHRLHKGEWCLVFLLLLLSLSEN